MIIQTSEWSHIYRQNKTSKNDPSGVEYYMYRKLTEQQNAFENYLYN